MTESIKEGPFSSAIEAKRNGWFSRRHKTDEAHQAAKATRAALAKERKQRELDQAAATKKRKENERRQQRR